MCIHIYIYIYIESQTWAPERTAGWVRLAGCTSSPFSRVAAWARVAACWCLVGWNQVWWGAQLVSFVLASNMLAVRGPPPGNINRRLRHGAKKPQAT